MFVNNIRHRDLKIAQLNFDYTLIPPQNSAVGDFFQFTDPVKATVESKCYFSSFISKINLK